MLTLQATQKEIKITTEDKFVRGTVGVNCQIIFDEFWQDYDKFVVFERTNTCGKPIEIFAKSMDFIATIPPEILAESGSFVIGAYGLKQDEVLPILYSDNIKILYGTETSGTPPTEPTPNPYEQIIAIAKETEQIAQSVRDDADSGKFDGKDGYTPIKGVDYFDGDKGDKGDSYILTESDKTEIADMLKPKKVTFTNGTTITVEDNTSYYADTEISNLTIVYPTTDFICSFDFTIASEGDITITLPESKYIGGTPSFANGETWEVNIKNGVVVGGLVE